MENQYICQNCQINPVKWYCTDHNVRTCEECTFNNHKKCKKTNPQAPKYEKPCIKCKIRSPNIFCKAHSLLLCDECYYAEHTNCEGILASKYNQTQKDFVSQLRQTKINEFKTKRLETKDKLADIIDKIIKKLTIIKDQFVQIDSQTEQFIEQQLNELEIRIGKSKIQSLNELYIEKCHQTQQDITNQSIQKLNTINQEIQNLIDLINQTKQSKFKIEEFKKNVVLPIDDSEVEEYLQIKQMNEEECKFILPTNSTQPCNNIIIYNKETKQLLASGCNDHGQLGIGNTTDQNKPVKITNQFANQKIVQISCGEEHSIILTDVGIYTFGRNGFGQLGNGTNTDSSSPINITNQFKGEKVKIITTGRFHSAVITNNNQLYTFGYNGDGQLGDNSTTDRSTPVNITANIIISHNNNNINNNNNNNNQFNQQQQSEYIISISCDFTHSLVLTNQSLYAFGRNEEGQLGIGDQQKGNQLLPMKIDKYFQQDTKFKQALCGYYHSIVLTNKGLFTFGYNKDGELGNNSTTNSFSPINIIDKFNNEKIISIQCGHYHNIVQTENNIYSFGYNEEGQLGDGSTKKKLEPIKITDQIKKIMNSKIKQIECVGYNNFIETDKGLYGFGWNKYGGLGNGNSNESQSIPLLLDEYFK